MIVRIATEGQYELDEGRLEELNALDNACVAAVEGGDEAEFQRTYDRMLDLVRSAGTALGEDELAESALILPPADLTFAEAAEHFEGNGLIPD